MKSSKYRNSTSKNKFGFINSNKLSFQEKYNKLIKLQCSPSSKKKVINLIAVYQMKHYLN